MKKKLKKLSKLAKKWEELGILDGLMAANPNSTVFDVFKNTKYLEIKKLEKKLAKKKKLNRDLWSSYGTELCHDDLIKQENRIEEQIKKLRDELDN